MADIYGLIDKGFVGSAEWTDALGLAMAREVATKFDAEIRNGQGYLRPSNLGEECDRKLWFSVNQPETKEQLPSEARIKFLFGDILEELLLALAEACGHTVSCRQKEVTYLGLVGHIDAIIDGTLVDCKSASSIAFKKFSNHLTPDKDSFGYLSQIGFYLEAVQNEPEITDHERAAFLVIDKTLGHICLDFHSRSDLSQDWSERVNRKTKAIASQALPNRGYFPEKDGASGNLKLGLECSYCPFKQQCWPGLRTFLYAQGPRYLTHVVRTPDVREV